MKEYASTTKDEDSLVNVKSAALVSGAHLIFTSYPFMGCVYLIWMTLDLSSKETG